MFLGFNACCCQGGQLCDIHFNSFDSGDTSGYTIWNCMDGPGPAGGCHDPAWGVGSGELLMTAGWSALTHEAIVLDDPPDDFDRFVESDVQTAFISGTRGGGFPGVCIGVPHGQGNDTEPVSAPQNKPWALLYWNTIQMPSDPLAGTGGVTPSQGCIILQYGVGDGSFGGDNDWMIVKWGVAPQGALEEGPSIRLEVHGVPSTGIYDLHCYVDDVLVHVACGVDLPSFDTTATPIGVWADSMGIWEYLCIGRDYESRTRYCTHTPNQYDLTLTNAEVLAADAASPCQGPWHWGADSGTFGVTYTWHLRKRSGNATTCIFASYTLAVGWDTGDAEVPHWELTITDEGGGDYNFRLVRWNRGVIANTFVQIIWEEDFTGGYPTSGIVLNVNAAESDCTVTEPATITLVPSECGAIDQPPTVDTGCCDDVPKVLGVTANPSGDSTIAAFDLTYDGSARWVGTMEITYDTPAVGCPSPEEYTLYLRCVPLGGDIEAEEADFAGWALQIIGPGGGLTVRLATGEFVCDPFELNFGDVDFSTLRDPDCQSQDVNIVITG